MDRKGLFWDLCIGFPGSVHDARVLKQSHLRERLNDGHILGQNKVNIAGCDVGHFLIGDPAFPLQNWLMKPFSDTGRLTPHKQCKVCSGDELWEAERTMALSPKAKRLQPGPCKEDGADLLCAPQYL